MTDTINLPPRSARRIHSPFPRAPLLPRRSGLCYLTTFRRPFRAPFDWGVSVYRGCAIAPPPACGLLPFQGLLGAGICRGFVWLDICCVGGCLSTSRRRFSIRLVGLHHLPVVRRPVGARWGRLLSSTRGRRLPTHRSDNYSHFLTPSLILKVR